MALTLRYVTHSEIGLVRKNNQDSGYASPNLLAVADGMGGAAAGDLASAVAIEAIREVDAPTPAAEMLDVLARALHQANDRIADLVEDDPTLEGMGTTVTGALFDGHELGLAHIGDSRAYLYRDGTLERLTHDHSWVQSLVDDGKIDEAEASVHPHRSLLLKVLNGQTSNEPDLTRITLALGDRLLFCSDGLCGLVPDAQLARGLALPEPAAALGRLVGDALAEGGVDNITVILADVVETGGTTEPVVLGAAAQPDLPTTPLRTGGATAVAAGGSPAVAAVAGSTSKDSTPSGPTQSSPTPSSPAPSGSASTGPQIEDEARYNPQPPAQRRLARPLLGVLVLLLVVGAGLGSAWSWTRTQYFVGASGEQVAIFQGLPDDVVVPLSRVYEVQPLTLAALPPYYLQQVQAGIEVSSLESARQTVAELTEAAGRCTQGDKKPDASPSAKPTAEAGPTTPAPSGGTAAPSAKSPTAGPGC